ncbi:hypothetical protein BG000_004577 [Podila horticola]|nr:hypothetical protein BG000_004577 [Podila horticola]
MVQLQINTKVASIHKSTPFSLFFGRPFAGLKNFSDVESRLLTEEELHQRHEYFTNMVFPAVAEGSSSYQQTMAKQFNRSHKIVDFPKGSFVMARHEESTGALEAKYEGPFMVVRRTARGSYVLRDNLQQILARNYSPDQLKMVVPLTDDITVKPRSYEIEKIVGHDLGSEGEMLYQVKWKGYDESWNDWLSFSHFDSKAIVTEYHKKHNLETNTVLHAKHIRKHGKAVKKDSKQPWSSHDATVPKSKRRRYNKND